MLALYDGTDDTSHSTTRRSSAVQLLTDWFDRLAKCVCMSGCFRLGFGSMADFTFGHFGYVLRQWYWKVTAARARGRRNTFRAGGSVGTLMEI